MKKKKGFTLVELLAVIVILAVILVIAVPRISEVINNSKKASFEATAKTIASQAEKKKMENEVLGKTGNFECSDVVKINSSDYASCNITFDTNGNALVSITGSGKFAGLVINNATKNSATATELTETAAKYFSYDVKIDGLTSDKSKIYDVTVVDQGKCVAYVKNMNVTEEQATTLCNGGDVDGVTLAYSVKVGRIPESDYETAGLKVDIYNKIKDITVTDQNKCESYLVSKFSAPQEIATTACSGGVINGEGETLVDFVKYGDIPESDYDLAGLNVKDVYKLYENVTVTDQSKCVTYLMNLWNDTSDEGEQDATTFCTGGDVDGVTLLDFVKKSYIPSLSYDLAGLKVTSKVYDKETITITGYNVAGGLDVVIPSYIDGYKVTTIADKAFTTQGVIPKGISNTNNNYQIKKLNYSDSNNYVVKRIEASVGLGIKSVVIPDTVKTIGKKAFYQNELTSIVIPSSVTLIGDYAFAVNQLTNVVIPSSVTYIGNYAFKNNSNIVITNNSSIENTVGVWDKILDLDGACPSEVTITNNIIEIGIMPVC